MTLQFIIGRAGTGKTHACLEAVREELLTRPGGPQLILLVPEQATFQMEYSLAATPGLKGFIRAQVLSFRRLAYRVLQEVGGAARPHIGELGKRMILRRFLEQRRSELKVFRRSVNLPGFPDTLARVLGEMKTYCVCPDDLAAASSALQGKGGTESLGQKLDDLYLLYADLEYYLAGRFTDPDDYLNLLADRLEYASAVRGALVWVDGFSGFTPQEFRVLSALARTAGRVSITLCADLISLSRSLDETDLFYPVRETYDSLCEMASKERIAIERPVVLDKGVPRRFCSQAIAFLEKNFFNRAASPQDGSGEGVILAAAANPVAEVEGAAREITALCRDRGYRFREIVVLLRDLDSYAHLISNIFTDHGIPVFLDQKRTVTHHPLVEFVRSALEVVAKDWSFDPVFRYLKTDFVPLSREEVDLLENYVLAHGIRGSRWTDERPWEYRRRLTLEEDLEITELESKELEEINCIRRQAAAGLYAFQQELEYAENVRGMTLALYNLIERLEVRELMESWSRRAEEEGRLEAAREHAQLWDGLVALLDQVVEALGDEVLTLQEYAAILDSGLESMRLGLIPPGLDLVVVGSLDRSRSPEARAAFIMGVSDGVLPARVGDQGILSELEREQLKEVGLQLAPGSRRKVFEEQYLVYIALTRSSERLYLTYPLADEMGGAIMPSPVISRLKELLPGVGERVWPVEPNAAVSDDLEFVGNPRRSLSYLAAQIREMKAGRPVNPLWWDVYSWFAGGEYRAECARVLSGIFYSNRETGLGPELGRRLYGKSLKTGISGIEKFNACPFAHFMSYGLRLRERALFKLGAPDLGQFFHAALKNFGDRVREYGLDWGQLDRDQCRKLSGEAVDLLAPRLQSEILLSSARHRYLTGKLKRIVQRATMVLAEHSKRGKFRPVGLELSFGPGGNLPAVTFVLSDGSEMALTGRIDRIDAVKTEDAVYLRVIDYKSSRVNINLADIYYGFKLQLLAYLDIALKFSQTLVGTQGLPGGILYFEIKDPFVNTDGGIPAEEETEKRILKELRMTGMVLADPAVARLMDGKLEGDSDLIPVHIKTNGDLGARSAVLTREQFDLLRLYLRRLLISSGSKIVGGVVDISPYRRGTFRSCQFCLFKAVCQFDILIDGNVYRTIKTEDIETIWQKLAGLTGGENNE